MASRSALDLDEDAPISMLYPAALRRAASHDEHVLSDGGAMVFEAVSYTRIAAYVGVREFSAPIPDMVVMPSQVMLEMGITDGATVKLTRVQLPSVMVRVHPQCRSQLPPPLQPHAAAAGPAGRLCAGAHAAAALCQL